MPRPDLVDNGATGTHAEALAYLVGDLAGHHLSVATGYVNLAGLHHVARLLEEDQPIRLLLGAMPEAGLGAELPAIAFETQMALLGGERDFSRFPPSRAAKRLQAVERWLASGQVEVRRYVHRFLHGKAYLFGSTADPRAALVTSANLTGAGLAGNLELGLVDYNPGPSGKALSWFDDLWSRSDPFTDDLRELLFPAVSLLDPETIYLRALLELYAGELAVGANPQTERIRLVDFQRDGYERARRILDRHAGVIYADGVGTGKTEIGLAFIEEYALRGGRLAVVICPAQLKESWEARIARARLPAQVLSFNELATDEQLVPDAASPRRHLSSDRDAYRLVVVDEAHALRNEGTTWYRAMERLLGGEPKHAVFLTATPVNNGLWDLFNLVMLFARHDRAFAPIGIPSARALFVAAGANERDPENLDPDLLFPLADAVSVRRDRVFIQRHYPGAVFPDGTPVRFPEPILRTERYDLDEASPGLFDDIVDDISRLEMARYRPGAFLLEPDDDAAEARLGGLLQSALLKRFESCWAAALATVDRMVIAHDAFLAAWAEGSVPSRATLREAVRADTSDSGIGAWVLEALEDDDESLPASAFQPDYGNLVAADRALLAGIRDRLAVLSPEDDPKLGLLKRLLEESPAQKVAVFASYGETIAYLDDQLESLAGGRERVTVIGGETDPDERMRRLARFCPRTVVRDDYVPPDGEVDLLLSTDVLSEGQNLQQAQAVVSYDMPWNPQRVVQRNGRVIRLRSPHEEVFLTTLLPAPGDLERLLGLESLVRAKIRAAGVFGMEVGVIEGVVETELRAYAARLAEGDATLLEEDGDDELAGAFLGEQLRATLQRAFEEGEIQRVERLPWGIGAVVRPAAPERRRGRPGAFFAVRTRPMPSAPEGHRYWRFVEVGDGDVVDSPLECLRRIDPAPNVVTDLGDLDLEQLWSRAATAIVDEHNRRADPRMTEQAIGPAQRFALELLRDPAVILPEGADEAAQALSVERSGRVRHELNEIRGAVAAGRMSRNDAAGRVVAMVRAAGLRPVAPDDVPEAISADDLAVVCWMAIVE